MPASYEYIGISVHDLQAQRDFYAAVFAAVIVEAEGDFPEAGIRTAIICSANGLRIELIERTGSTAQSRLGPHDRAATQGFTHLAIRVEDLAITLHAVAEAGGAVLSAPAAAQRAGVQFAYVSDPEGNLLELITDLPQL